MDMFNDDGHKLFRNHEILFSLNMFDRYVLAYEKFIEINQNFLNLLSKTEFKLFAMIT